MIYDVSVLDEFSYWFETDTGDYLLFITPKTQRTSNLHIVEVFSGVEGFYEFGEETYNASLWVVDSEFLERFVYSVAKFLLENDLDLKLPKALYETMGGTLCYPVDIPKIPKEQVH